MQAAGAGSWLERALRAALRRRGRPRPRLALYAVRRDGHAVRIDSALFHLSQQGLPNGRLADRSPSNTEPWRIADMQSVARGQLSIPPPPPPPPPTEAGEGGRGALYGWAAGAVLLAVLLLLVRSAEKWLHARLYKRNRRESDEWPRPHVRATSQQQSWDAGDPPPPYAQCARKAGGAEDPPPPYSACYVAFSNPKDGIPSVHFFNRRQNLLDGADTSTIRSDANNPIVRDDGEPSAANYYTEERRDPELAFANGGAVERETSNDTHRANVAHNSIQDPSAGVVVVDMNNDRSRDVPLNV